MPPTHPTLFVVGRVREHDPAVHGLPQTLRARLETIVGAPTPSTPVQFSGQFVLRIRLDELDDALIAGFLAPDMAIDDRFGPGAAGPGLPPLRVPCFQPKLPPSDVAYAFVRVYQPEPGAPEQVARTLAHVRTSVAEIEPLVMAVATPSGWGAGVPSSVRVELGDIPLRRARRWRLGAPLPRMCRPFEAADGKGCEAIDVVTASSIDSAVEVDLGSPDIDDIDELVAVSVRTAWDPRDLEDPWSRRFRGAILDLDPSLEDDPDAWRKALDARVDAPGDTRLPEIVRYFEDDLLGVLSGDGDDRYLVRQPALRSALKALQDTPMMHVEDLGVITAAARETWDARGATPRWWTAEAAHEVGSDAWFLDRVVNGMRPILPFEAEHEGERVVVFEVLWDPADLDPKSPYAVGRVDVRVILGGLVDGTAVDGPRFSQDPELRAIQHRAPGTDAWTTVTPDPRGGADRYSPWGHAKALAMTAQVVAGEIDVHLARAHLHAEQLLIPALRNLEGDHPLLLLLHPHLRSSDRINRYGDPLILGSRGVLAQCSGLSPDGVTRRLRERLGAVCWDGGAGPYRPRRPLFPMDRYGRAATAFHEAIRVGVAAYFEDHPLDDARWRSVDAFMSELVAHAVPATPYQGVERAWVDDGPVPPARGDVALRALDAAARQSDLEALCTHAIHSATFLHSWVGGAQFQDGGDVVWGALGSRSVEAPADAAAFQADVGPLPEHAAIQLLMAELLSQQDFGVWADSVVQEPPNWWVAVGRGGAEARAIEAELIEVRRRQARVSDVVRQLRNAVDAAASAEGALDLAQIGVRVNI